mgnify:CR=1 FL=1
MNLQSPVDVVYLWVDGNDPVWRQKRRSAEARLGSSISHTLALFGNVEGRYRDNDELRYNLRALERFFPGHGHIYLVTDAQTPAWLQAHPGITVVDHHTLIPATALPTFDSAHIESYIHHIPILSDHYFYFNYYVFFGAPVKLDDWFWSGGVYVGWSDEPEVSDEALRMDATALENACRLSIQWLNDKAGAGTPAGRAPDPGYQSTFRTFAHSPRPMLRSVLLELEDQAPELFASVRSTVFRSWDKPTIISDFVLRWALAHGVASLRPYRHRYVSTGEADQHEQLQALLAEFGALDFFCINDTTDDAQTSDPRLQNVLTLLQSILPSPSGFEKATASALDPARLRLAAPTFEAMPIRLDTSASDSVREVSFGSFRSRA